MNRLKINVPQLTVQSLHKRKTILAYTIRNIKNDTRKDSIVKEELFVTHVKDRFNIKAVIDDRTSVIKMWKRIGLNLIHVGNQLESF